MDHRHLGLLISLGLVASLFTPSFVYAGNLPRHVDPDELEEENPSASELFLLYKQLFQLVTAGDFTEAYGVLDWAYEVYAPSRTEPVLTRFNELLACEIGELNLTKFHIDEAIESLRWMREGDAEQALGQALLHLTEANVTVGLFENAGVQLASTLHASPAPLLEGVEAVRELIEMYLELIRRLLAEAILINVKRGGEVEEEEVDLLAAHPEVSEEMVQRLVEELVAELLASGPELTVEMIQRLLEELLRELLEAYPDISEEMLRQLIAKLLAELLETYPELTPEMIQRLLEMLMAELLAAHPEVSEEMIYRVMMRYRENPLLETRLYIETDKSEVFVGTNISVRGYLVAENGTGLRSRTVDLVLDGVWVGEAVTGSGGNFSVVVGVPYLYKASITILAVYWPREGDLGVFFPSISNILVLDLLYYTPLLEVEGPGRVFPGTLASISGGLSFEGEPLQGFEVRVMAFSDVFDAVTGVDGGFVADFFVPVDAPSGLESVRVESLPVDVYGPAVAELGLEVVRVLAELKVRAPHWIFSGGRMRVRGVVSVVGEPLNGSRIVLKSGERVVSSTSMEDGSFEAWLGLSLALFTARYIYRVTAYPVEAWVTQCTVSRSVFVVNAFTLIGGPVFLGVAIVYAFQRIQWCPGRRKEEEQVGVEVDIAEPEAGPEAPARRFESLWDFYWGAVRLFSRASGLFMAPSQTIREYLEAVRERLGGVGYGVFRRLSLLYERWLYGVPSRGRKSRGRRFFERVKELFKSED